MSEACPKCGQPLNGTPMGSYCSSDPFCGWIDGIDVGPRKPRIPAAAITKMAAYWLEQASEEYGSHGCNDLDKEFIKTCGLTDVEKITFVREYHEWNGDLAEVEEDEKITAKSFGRLPDFAVMGFLAHKLKG